MSKFRDWKWAKCKGCGRRYKLTNYAELSAAIQKKTPSCSKKCHDKLNPPRTRGV